MVGSGSEKKVPDSTGSGSATLLLTVGNCFPWHGCQGFCTPRHFLHKWPAGQRRQPSHLYLYTKVWGEAMWRRAGVQQQHLRPTPSTTELRASHMQLLFASCYLEEEGGGGSPLLHNPHPTQSSQFNKDLSFFNCCVFNYALGSPQHDN